MTPETERQTVVWRNPSKNSLSINEHQLLNSNNHININSQILKASSFKVNTQKQKNANGTSIRPAFPKTSASHFLPSSKINFSFQNGIIF